MNIVFFGSDTFAVPSLEALLSNGYNIPLVVTQPDRRKGRGLHLEATPLKLAAKKAKLDILQPQNINSPGAVKALKKAAPDLFVVLAYGQILSEEILSLPGLFALNIHASLLPKYRGAAPINWAIINGERTSGVTAMKIIKKMDAGPVIFQEKVDIGDDDTASSLSERLSLAGGQLLLKTLKAIENKGFSFSPQDDAEASFAPKLKKSDGLIDWSFAAQKIHSLIRGCYDWPGAFTCYRKKLLKIYKAGVFLSMENPSLKTLPGEVIRVCKDEIIVSTGCGDLLIEELQLEGKRRMQAHEFIQGHKIKAGEKLG